MIKILFLINTLGGGGAERVMVNLINNMDKSKFDITVCTMFADGVNKKMLCDDVKYYCKNKLGIRGLSNFIKYIPAKMLYKYYIGNVKYDIIVAYMHGAPTKVVSGCRDKNTKLVTWLHYGNPEKGSFFDYWINRKKAIQAYATFDAIVGVSKSVTNAFSKYTGIRAICHTLYNTNDTNMILQLSKNKPDFKIEKSDRLVFCASGRLTDQKGFDRLIDASVRLHNEGYRFYVFIMGTGPDEKKLKEIIFSKDANSYIKMLGFCSNPYAIMKQCDVYILSSRDEGLATVLTEALTLEIPIISTEVSGANEVLGEKNEYGLVVQNSEDGILNGMKTFLNDSELMKKYKAVSKKRSEKFDTEHTLRNTEKFFEDIVGL